MARRFQRWPEWLPGSSGRGFFRAQWVRDARMILDGLAGRPPPPFTHRDARRCLRGCRSSTGEPDVCGPTWSLPDGRARRLRTEVVAPRRASPTSADRSGCPMKRLRDRRRPSIGRRGAERQLSHSSARRKTQGPTRQQVTRATARLRKRPGRAAALINIPLRDFRPAPLRVVGSARRPAGRARWPRLLTLTGACIHVTSVVLSLSVIEEYS